MSCNTFLEKMQTTRQHALQEEYEQSLYPPRVNAIFQDSPEEEEQIDVFVPSWQDVYDLYSESYI